MKKNLPWICLMTAALLVSGTAAMAQGPGPKEGRPCGRPDALNDAPKDAPEFAPGPDGARDFPPPPCAEGPKGHHLPFADGEGRIEIEKVVRFLTDMDTDRDGFVSRQERRAFFEEQGMPRLAKPFGPPDGPKDGFHESPKHGPQKGHPQKEQGFWREGETPDRGHFMKNPPDRDRWDGNRPGPRPDGDWKGPKMNGDRPGPRPDGDWKGPKMNGDRPGPRPDGDWKGPKMDGDRPGPRPDGDWKGPKMDADRPGPRPDGDHHKAPKMNGAKKNHKKHGVRSDKNAPGPNMPAPNAPGPEGPAPDAPNEPGPDGPAPEE